MLSDSSNGLFSKIKNETKTYRPLTIEWDMTYRCPCSCVHCYQRNNNVEKELTRDEIFSVIDDLNLLGAFEYKISGGDPLVRKDIFEILSYLSNKQVKIIFYTSGFFMNEENCKKLAETGITCVETTLLGLDSMTHDHLSNCKGAFNQIIYGVKLLSHLNIPVRIKFMLLHQNFNQMEHINKLAEELSLNIDPVPFLWCVHKESEDTILPFRLTFEEQKEYFSKYPIVPVKKSFVSCNAGKYKLAISPDGHVKACGAYTDEYSVGNLRLQNIKEIWQNSQQLNEMRSKHRYPVSQCRICSLSEFCVLCPAIASWASQDIIKPYLPMCQYAKAAQSVYEEY